MMRLPKRSGVVELNHDNAQIMGVLNVTPDSFSDGGQYFSSDNSHLDACVRRAATMVDQGAAIVDVGGESTRPNAAAVTIQQELDRVIPVIERVASEVDCVISVDTSQPAVMREAVRTGAGFINDVRAFRLEGAVETVAQLNVPLCLMHMAGTPQTMQQKPIYKNVVSEVRQFLAQRIKVLEAANIDTTQIAIDPGFGFGKTLEHNLQLLASLEKLNVLGNSLLVGMSRKSMIGEILNKPVADRLYGGLALATIAVLKGAAIVRTHDVAETRDALDVVDAFKRAANSNSCGK